MESQSVQLLQKLLENRLLPADMFAVQEIDSLLNDRDAAPFDAEWMRVHNAIFTLMPGRKKSLTVEKIREVAFKRAFNATQSADLAGYVSDDLGLIADALELGYEDTWLNALAMAYVDQRVPSGAIQPVKGALMVLLNL